MGACLSPHNAYMQSMGLDTLDLRTERSTSNALQMAGWLENHSDVQEVHYPGLKSSLFHEIAVKQFGEKPCSMLTFDLESKKHCYAFMNRLKLARRSTNLQDNKTLIIHPASTTHRQLNEEQQIKAGVRPDMVRVSVGIEHIDDILWDIDQALASVG